MNKVCTTKACKQKSLIGLDLGYRI
jgi:hypothetical protein